MKRLLMTSIVMASIMTQAAINSPRSGEIFQTTREGPGLYAPACVYYGLLTPVVGWVTLIPAGIVIGVVDELVVSPAIDLVCLPCAYRSAYRVRLDCHSKLPQVRQAKLGRTNSGRSYIVKKSTYD